MTVPTENSARTATPRGRPFKPGQSGNPGGRPKLTGRALEVRRACREASVRAVERLAELLEADDLGVSLRAAEALLTRAWGAPGSEADVRQTDTARMLDARERDGEAAGERSLLRRLEEGGPPPDVD